MQINWDSFKLFNQSADGVQLKFEDLCRQLFANENLSGNKQFRYLHANPNNYGLETEPIYDEVSKRWVGFQAKFFSGRPDYDQIKRSVEKIVEYYTGKVGVVDLVYLFCNQSLSSTAPKFLETVCLLRENNIEVQLITNEAILDLVQFKYPYLAPYYFGNHEITSDWFITHNGYMFDELGERYNKTFHVETDATIELSLFMHDKRGTDYINSKKDDVIAEIDRLYWKHHEYRVYLDSLREAVSRLPDVNSETLLHAIEWREAVLSEVSSFIENITAERDQLQDRRNTLQKRVHAYDTSEKATEEEIKEYRRITDRIHELGELISVHNSLELPEREKQLLRSSVMIVRGRAGTGKSQLLAWKTNELSCENRSALLLLAGDYLSDSPIHEQIMSNLHLHYSIEELIDVLETIGERDNCVVPVLIDALNETWHNRLWKTELPVIVDIITKSPMVRLVVSYRTEFESALLSDSLRDKKHSGEIGSIFNVGFEGNSGTAIREFLNHYNIPFSPVEYFSPEMTNPLFLTLYCKTYNGDEVGLPELYERLIQRANSHAFSKLKLHTLGFTESDKIVEPLISQLARYMINNRRRTIPKSDLMKLEFWSQYGLTPAAFIRCLVSEELLHENTNEQTDYLYFAFDQMNDYYCAKVILDQYTNKEDVRHYLGTCVLGIEEGKLGNPGGIDLFVNACALYATKYGDECIDIIDSLTEKYDQWEVFSRYIDSFQWRNADHINKEQIYDLLGKYPCKPDTLWSMLIGNSIKVHHPLNADFLHEFLSHYKLNKRDFLWTIYINKLTWEDENRLVQLVEMYDRGEKLQNVNDRQLELLLTLLSWLLTSTNRWLRDYTSKAMIEMLKGSFQLCVPLLKKFQMVNDPYVIQRLYGIVFGAACKRVDGDLKTLAEYVYKNIFDQEKVYPDILLRDYARLIIERFLYENRNYSGIINKERIVPPYVSEPIPDMADQHYESQEYSGVMFWLMHSMRFEGIGMYGDFGRYVFQSALHYFDVDDRKIFNYSVHHILNDLGYNEEYFEEHDQHCGSYDRHQTAKTERIGKKYQWITMYNVLARVADHCKMLDRWSYPEKTEVFFDGAWDPYVRDFDPTLNENFMKCREAPIFHALKEHPTRGKEENHTVNPGDADSERTFLNEPGLFFYELKSALMLTDENNGKWVCLTKYCDTGGRASNKERYQTWCWHYAYFMTMEQSKEIQKCAEKGLPILSHEIASYHQTYSVFNREYPWSPSCREFEEDAWVDAHIGTGEFETITETVPIAVHSPVDIILEKYSGLFPDEDLEDAVEPDWNEMIAVANHEDGYKEVVREKEIFIDLGKILHATTDLLWEEEYDATKSEPISRSVPCALLLEKMNLRQMTADGFYFDSDGNLAAFDTDLTQNVNSVVVRKDILDEFLEKIGMKLVWLCKGEKEIHSGDYTVSEWTDWEGVYVYGGDHITGEMRRLQNKNNW